jgi:DNA-directed RNA polymerase alpha subunit
VQTRELNAHDVLGSDSLVFLKESLIVLEETFLTKKSATSKPAGAKKVSSPTKSKKPDAIEDAGLSTRAVNALQKAGIANLMDLKGKSLEDVQRIKGLGLKSAQEIIDHLEKK